ncbi:hypothetical protein FZO89_08100 [Luteimonas viscosa]|uniref:Beta-barrel assembly machine subunit BamC n=1 Tax=Luteimonas viscosa TaxID=1132694 RepID=A0A5D4XNJ5_9GAMM|nr:hypothetical protein [Luteimonas viscosa]TYT26226.1 hypothetical protein FZO89_08100 [Luteimonas viscosa]
MSVVRNRVTRLCTAMLAVASLLPGCQRAGNSIAETAIERATRGYGDAADTAPGHSGVRAPAGADSLALPGHFPEDVYLPDGYRVNSVMDLQDVSVLSLSAPGEVGPLFVAARDAMQAQGWTQTLAAQHSVDTAMLAFEKDGGDGARSATLSFNRNNGDERVIVGVQLRQRRH